MNLIELRRKELLTYHCGCVGNLIIMATRYVADLSNLDQFVILGMPFCVLAGYSVLTYANDSLTY